MITNGTVNINGKDYKAHVFIQNKITDDDMGERLNCEASVRAPICKNEGIDIGLGETIFINGENWKTVKITLNRTGMNPHYHLKGVK